MSLSSAQKFTEAKAKLNQILEDDTLTFQEMFKYVTELQKIVDLMGDKYEKFLMKKD